ncbi:MAG: PIN domain-containing protein [bacterium]
MTNREAPIKKPKEDQLKYTPLVKKAIFIDTNIFIKESMEEFSSANLFDELLKLLDDKKVHLLMPEIISIEVYDQIERKYKNLYKTIGEKKVSGVNETLSNHLKKEQGKILRRIQKKAKIGFDKLLNHPNTNCLKITDDLILHTLKRQLQKRAPSSKVGKKPDGRSGVVDHDSLAFETLLHELNNGKFESIIFCTDDKDFYLDIERNLINPQMERELKSLVHLDDVASYSDAWTLLEEHFDILFDHRKEKHYSGKFTKFWEYPTSFEEVQTTTPIPGSILKGETLTCLYWYGSDGYRYTIANEDILRSWFPKSGLQPVINRVTDSDLADIALGGNITYRAGTRLIKIDSDSKIYTVGANGLIHWIQSDEVIAEIFGSRWRELLVVIPDALFTNYSIGDVIESEHDFNPEEVKNIARLP